MILERILAEKREEVARRRQELPLHALAAAAKSQPPARGFRQALAARDTVGVIAEVKRRSPSKGPLREDLDPSTLAQAYQHGGAACVSVLTDEPFFGGSRADLQAAREAVSLPVLRKDFIIDPYQVYEARAWGADAVLLIVAAVSAQQLGELLALTEELGMDALVEVHTAAELEAALAAGARLVGINNRDLRSFVTTLDVSLTLAGRIPPGVVLVSESGIQTRADVERLAAAGADAILVGETCVKSPDPSGAVASLAGVPRRGRAGVAAS
ncbi:MAG TPA: indole-3-glycerol phosphate synthase TrpC [Limnochordales bacterium]